MADDDLWTLERLLWTEGPDAYDRIMDDMAVMVFAEPTGILVDGQILAALDGNPRWSDCEMTDRVERHRNGTSVLAYRARARRDAREYAALCTSVWHHTAAGPRIVAHQQTPGG